MTDIDKIKEHLLLPLRFRLFESSRHPTKGETRDAFGRIEDKGVTPVGPAIISRRKLITIEDHEYTIKWSLGIFQLDTLPAFISKSAPDPLKHLFEEERFGYLLIVSNGTHIVVNVSGANWDRQCLTEVATPVSHAKMRRLTSALARSIERMSLRSLSISREVIRDQTLEAEDLSRVMPTQAAGQQAPRAARFRSHSEQRWSVTLGTGHIQISAPRQPLSNYLATAASVMAQAGALPAATKRSFIDAFATPLEISELPAGVVPSATMIDLGRLRDGIAEGRIRIEISKGSAWRPLPDAVALAYADQLSETMQVEQHADDRLLLRHDSPILDRVIALRKNRSSYSLRGPLISRTRVVEDGNDPIGVRAWLRENESLRVVYNRPQYAYVLNHLFEDPQLLSTVDVLESMMRTDVNLAACTSEKHSADSLPTDATSFDKVSMFEWIESRTKSYDFVACDDLGDEWADYVSFSSLSERRLSFWHAKFDSKRSALSASKLHEVISQALKNLGHMRSDSKLLSSSKSSKWWTDKWGNTQISRVRHSVDNTWDDVIKRYEETVSSVDCVVEAHVVVNCLRASAVSKQFELIKKKNWNQCKFQTFHLVWLLSSFVSSCRAVGVRPVVWCRP